MKVHIDNDIVAALPEQTAEALELLRASLKREGCRDALLYAVIDGVYVQIDGHTRRKICVEEKIPFQWQQVTWITTKAEAIAWVKDNQGARRNCTPEQLALIRVVRVRHVHQLAAEGHSTHAIAEKVGVSQTQVRRDLEASVEPYGSTEQTTQSKPKENGTVKGRDDKTYPKQKKRSRTPKAFAVKEWESHFGYVLRGLDDMARACAERAAQGDRAFCGHKTAIHNAVQALEKVYETGTKIGRLVEAKK